MAKRVWLIYIGGFFLAMHYASIAYVNSSIVTQFTTDKFLGVLYILGSLGSIVSLVFAPLLLRKFGNVAVFLAFILIEGFAVFALGRADLALLVFIFFIVHQLAESILNLNLDILLEKETMSESTTGGKRGIFLTVQNVAWVAAPLILALIASSQEVRNIYTLSGLALIPLFLIIALSFRNNKNVDVASTHIKSALKALSRGGDEARIIGVRYVLDFYFAWMIMYLPLLLNQEMGFGWDKIGLILTIMLFPYLLFELPAGLLADKKYGEKEILILGFIIIILSTFLIPFIDLPIFGLWAATLFITRIGASMVEIGSETYFFKQVKASDTGLISLFRIARPASFILASIISIPVIYMTSYSSSFLFLAALTSLGLLFIPKRDTK